MFLKNKNIIFKIRRSKVTDYAAVKESGTIPRLSLVFEVLLCFVTFPCGVLGQLRCLIVSIPDLCLVTYIKENCHI